MHVLGFIFYLLIGPYGGWEAWGNHRPPINVYYSNSRLPQGTVRLEGFVNDSQLTHDRVEVFFDAPKPPVPRPSWKPGYWIKHSWKMLTSFSRGHIPQSVVFTGKEAEALYLLMTEPHLFVPRGVALERQTPGTENPVSGGFALYKPLNLEIEIGTDSLKAEQLTGDSIRGARLNASPFSLHLSNSHRGRLTSRTTSQVPIPISELRYRHFIKPLSFYSMVGQYHQFGVPRPDGLIVPFYPIAYHSNGQMVGVFKKDLEAAGPDHPVPVYGFPLETLRLAFDSSDVMQKWQTLVDERDQRNLESSSDDGLKPVSTQVGQKQDRWSKILESSKQGTFPLPLPLDKYPGVESALALLRPHVTEALHLNGHRQNYANGLTKKSDDSGFLRASERCNEMIQQFRKGNGR